MVTMGGAYSNHLLATALACQSENIPCYGIIRGSHFKYLSPTLEKSQALGMQLIFIDRESYRNIRSSENLSQVAELAALDGGYHFVPEGGSNELGVKGAEEILDNLDLSYEYVFCPVGTGGTLAGIIRYLDGNKKIVGISSLKDDYLIQQVHEMVGKDYKNWQVNFNYHFGGYAKWDENLIHFMNAFKSAHEIQLDPIYTGKMMFGLQQLIEAYFFPKGSSILAIHTGGLQGIEGFNQLHNNIID